MMGTFPFLGTTLLHPFSVSIIPLHMVRGFVASLGSRGSHKSQGYPLASVYVSFLTLPTPVVVL